MKHILLGLYLLVATSAFAADDWTMVRSKNFVLVGDASESQLLSVVHDLELFRYALSRFSPVRGSSVGTTVIAFRNAAGFEPYKLLYNGKPASISGYFLHGREANTIALSADVGPGVIYHEYVHSLMLDNVGSLPAWFNEGTAEYYRTFTPSRDGETFKVGLPISEHIALLKERGFMPLEQLLAVTASSPEYNENQKQGIFYAESWALVHYLMHGEGSKYQPQIPQFLAGLQRGTSAAQSFADVFHTDIAAFQKAFEAYVGQRGPFPSVQSSLRAELSPERGIRAQSLSAAQAAFYQGNLLLDQKRLPEAEPLLKEAIRLDPTLGVAYTSLGRLLGQSDPKEAIEFAKRGLDLDPGNNLAHYYYALAILEMGAGSPISFDELQAVRAELMKAIDIAPQFVEALELLVRVNLAVNENIDETLGLLSKALQMFPRRDSLVLMDAYVRLHTQDRNSVPAMLENLIARSFLNSRVRLEAQDLLDTLKEGRGPKSAARGKLPTLPSLRTLQLSAMTGFLMEYSCPRPDAPGFRLVVGTQNGQKSFFFPDPAAVATSGGKLDFDCGPQTSPRFVGVKFSPAQDTRIDGLLERITLDEQLPSPVAEVARTYFPTSIAIDSAGNKYIADKNGARIRKVTPAGQVSTAAGDGTAGFSGDGGLATAAQLKNPLAVAMDANGNLFIADTGNSRIRKVTPAGMIETVAGNGDEGFSGDGGPATLARLSGPASVVVDAADNLFIAESGTNRVRKVGKDGTISTVAGDGVPIFGGDGGPAASAQLSFPLGLAVDGNSNLYIADSGNNLVRRITTDGVITTVAGTPVVGKRIRGFSGDGGPATSAQLNLPFGVALDAAGNLYIADAGNARVRMVTPDGVITTVAGNGSRVSSGDSGPAIAAQLDAPWRVSVDQGGDLYIVEASGQRVRMVKQGEISSVQGSEAEAVTKSVTTPAKQQESIVTEPKCQINIQPQYSDEARRIRYSGTIAIEGTVLKDGSVRANRMVHALGFGLDERALVAFSLIKCSPGLRDGVPAEYVVRVDYNFQLR